MYMYIEKPKNKPYILLSDYQTNKLRTSILENVDVEYQKYY